MTGLDQLLADVLKSFNPVLAIISVALTSVVKPYVKIAIPDNLEDKIYNSVIQLITILICLAVGMFKMGLSWLVCIITGIVATGLYAEVMKSFKKLGGNGQ